MKIKNWLAWALLVSVTLCLLAGCGNKENGGESLPVEPPAISREGWTAYQVGGLCLLLPDAFEEGSVYEGNGTFVSQDDDFDGAYITIDVTYTPAEELGEDIEDAQGLAELLEQTIMENNGFISQKGTYDDVPYLIYSEYGAEQDLSVAGVYAAEGKTWIVEATGMDKDAAINMVPYVTGGEAKPLVCRNDPASAWNVYDVGGLTFRLPDEFLDKADFYEDCAYFASGELGVELEVSCEPMDDIAGDFDTAEELAQLFARMVEADGDEVMEIASHNGVPYVVWFDGFDSHVLAFYVKDGRHWTMGMEQIDGSRVGELLVYITNGSLTV